MADIILCPRTGLNRVAADDWPLHEWRERQVQAQHARNDAAILYLASNYREAIGEVQS